LPRCVSHLFGNPAILKSGPVALRHQIALVLPFRSTFSIELNRYEQNPDALFLCRELKIKQGRSLLPKMSALVSVKLIPVAKMRFPSLRQPGDPEIRTRGFASPDCSGFALSEYFFD